MILTGTTTLDQSRHGSNVDKGVIPCSKIEVSPLDAV